MSGHPHTPGGHEGRTGEIGIKLGVTCCEALPAGLHEHVIVKTRVRDKAEALENSAVVELIGIADQKIAICFFSLKVVIRDPDPD